MDLRQLKHIMKEFEASSIHKMEIIEKDFTVKLEKPSFNDVNNGQGNNVSNEVINKDNKEVSKASEQINNNVLIKAPLVGVFYESPSPDSDPFVKINQKVNKGDVVCIIEAMVLLRKYMLKTQIWSSLARF